MKTSNHLTRLKRTIVSVMEYMAVANLFVAPSCFLSYIILKTL